MTTRRISAGILAGLMAAALFLGAGQAQGQSSSAPPGTAKGKAAQTEQDSQAEDSSDMALKEIEVRSAVRRDELKSTSATVLENKDLVDRKYVQPLDMLKLSPGTTITQYGENGLAPQSFIRGLSGSHSGHLAIFLDGIPLKDSGHSDNYVDSNLIIPLEIESLEIIKGPQSVYYGAGSAAGVMAYQGYTTGDFNRLSLRYGSFNETDAQALIGKTDDKLSQVYAFQFYHTDGWSQNSDWDRGNVSGRWTYQFTDQFSASLNVRGYKSAWNSSDYLSAWKNLPDDASVDDGSGEGSGGQRRRFDARLWTNYKLNDESQFTLYTFTTDLTNTRWRKEYPSSSGVFNDSNNAEQTNSRKAYGVGTAYNFKGDIGPREANYTVGLDYLRENETQERYLLPWGTGRVRGRQRSDYEFTLDTASLYGEASYQVLDPLQVRLGARYDRFTGSMDTGPNQEASNTGTARERKPNSHYESPGANAFSPKAGLLLTPLDWLDVYTNYGRGITVAGLSNGLFFTEAPPTTKFDQYELGYRVRPQDWLNLEMTYYLVNQFNEELAVLDENTGRAIPGEFTYAGKTERSGLETSVGIHPWEFWSLTGNYTYQKAIYKKREATATGIAGNKLADYEGLRLLNVPKHIYNLELAYAPDEGFGGRLNYRWEADLMIRDDPASAIDGTKNTNPYRQYKGQDKGSMDMQLSYKFNEKYKLYLDVLNLTDRRNYGNETANDKGLNTYSIQPPRTFYLGLDVNWE